MNAINWFEIPAADYERAVAFYEGLLGAALHREDMGGQQIASVGKVIQTQASVLQFPAAAANAVVLLVVVLLMVSALVRQLYQNFTKGKERYINAGKLYMVVKDYMTFCFRTCFLVPYLNDLN